MHPRYLDAKGLVALWREALLVQAVLRGETRGQLDYERQRLEQKLAVRDPARLLELGKIKRLEPYPLFAVVRSPIEPWEKPT